MYLGLGDNSYNEKGGISWIFLKIEKATPRVTMKRRFGYFIRRYWQRGTIKTRERWPSCFLRTATLSDSMAVKWMDESKSNLCLGKSSLIIRHPSMSPSCEKCVFSLPARYFAPSPGWCR